MLEPEPVRQRTPSAARLALTVALWVAGALALAYLKTVPGVPLPDWSEAHVSNLELAHGAARLSLYVATIPETADWDTGHLARALREEAMRRYEVELALPGDDSEAVAALCVLYNGRGYVPQIGELLAAAVARDPNRRELFGALATGYLQPHLPAGRVSGIGDGIAQLPGWLQALVLADVYARAGDARRARAAEQLALTESVRYGRWVVAIAVVGIGAALVSILVALAALVLAVFRRGLPAAPRPPVRWHMADVAEVLGLLFFISVLLALGRSLAEQHLPRTLGPLMRLVGHSVTYVLTVVPLAFLAISRARRRQYGWREALGMRPLAVTRHLVQGLVVFGIALPVVPALTAQLSAWLGRLPAWGLTMGAAGAGSLLGGPGGRVWLVATFGVVAVLVAPVAEEIIFRGFVQGALRGRLAPVATYLASALLFAVLHLKFDPEAFSATLVMGLVLAITYEKTRSVYPGMVVHALTNAYVLALMLVQTL